MPSSSAEDFFDGLDIDEDAALAALEAAEGGQTTRNATAGPSRWQLSRRGSIDDIEEFSESEIIQVLDEDDLVEGAEAPGRLKRPGDLSAGRSNSNNLASKSKWRQFDLHGKAIGPSNPQTSSSSLKRLSSSKSWDDEEIEKNKTLRRRRKAGIMDDEESDDQHESYSRAQSGPRTEHPKLPPGSHSCVALDQEAAKTWIYPTNMPRRDYQFNIVQKALLDNVLVALPTGLGKTFIAAVVILNYFRWFPTGKIIFVAPTRPLVAQQQKACHGICGLPWDTAIELTGSTKVSLRGDEWESKRIFYMTPQTFENDLLSTNCDARQVVCLVVDEAHRATGNFAYCNVVRHLMKQNPNFRLLALTATPGSTCERVQEVVDNLHIGDVQMRSEDAMDIRPYVHQKKEHIVIAEFDDEMRELVEAWRKLMQQYLDPVVRAGIIYQSDPLRLHPYAAQSKLGELKRDPTKRQHFGNLSTLAGLARARVHLMEYSIEMFRVSAGLEKSDKKIQGKAPPSKSAAAKGVALDGISKILGRMQHSADRNSIPHPKMRKLFETIRDHFVEHTTDETMLQEAHLLSTQGRAGVPPAGMRQTRAIVFCSLRDCVNEIVKYLNEEGDCYDIRATHFIGQANTKNGKGLRQKEQESVINNFKSGFFNVIVSTSIGEEGLDIGDVDLIVNYDSVKDSVRSLQRVGRTGRKRDGKIVIMCAEGGMEAEGWKKAKESYKEVQQEIHSNFGSGIQTYTDIARMLPKDISPTVLLQDVEQPDFEPAMIGRKTREFKPKVKRKTLKEARKDPPKGSVLGFVTASKLEILSGRDSEDEDAKASGATSRKGRKSLETAKGKKKESAKAKGKKKASGVPEKAFSDETDSDSDDPPSRTNARPAPAARPSTSRAMPRSLANDDDDGSDELEDLSIILRKANGASHANTRIPARSTTALKEHNRTTRGSSDVPIVISDDEGAAAAPIIKQGEMPAPRLPKLALTSSDFDVSWDTSEVEAVMAAAEAQQRARADQLRLQAVEDNSSCVPREDSSPIRRGHQAAEQLIDEEEEGDSPPRTLKRGPPAPEIAKLMAELEAAEAATKAAKKPPASSAARKKKGKAVVTPDQTKRRGQVGTDSDISDDDHLFDDDGIDDFEVQTAPLRVAPAPPVARQEMTRTPAQPLKLALDDQPEADSSSSRIYVRPRGRLAVAADASSSPIAGPSRIRFARPAAMAASSPPDDELMPAPTLLPRGLKRRNVIDVAPTPLKKTKGKEKAQPTERKQKKKRIGNSPTSRLFFVDQADRSTDDERHGELDEDDEGLDTCEEDDDDRQAVGHFAPTQGPKGYDQQSVYARSLFTQMLPTPFRPVPRGGFPGVGGHFGLQASPARPGRDPGASASSNRRRVSSINTPQYGPNGTPDRYSEDSFCAADDEEIEYESGTGGTRSSQL